MIVFNKSILVFVLLITYTISGQVINGIATYKKEQLVFKTETKEGKEFAKDDPVGYQLALEIDKIKRSYIV